MFNREEHKLPLVTMLHGHISPDMAYVIEDYPYGSRLRCRRRVWVETAAKGAKRGKQRFVAQTTNPKAAGEPWNKPHAGQYYQLVYLYVDQSTGHVEHTTVSDWGPSPEQHARYVLNGMYRQMNADEREIYDAMVSRSRKYAEQWDRFDDLVNLVRAYIAEHDALPERDNNVVVLNDKRFHQYGGEWRITVAAAVTDGSENELPADDDVDLDAAFAALAL